MGRAHDPLAVGGHIRAEPLQVDILTPLDHFNTGIRASDATVLTTDGGRYLNAGCSSVFYKAVTFSMVAGAVYNASGLYAGAGNSFAAARFYFTSNKQTAGLTIQPKSDNAVENIHVYHNSGAKKQWFTATAVYTATAADAGKPLYLNLESKRNIATALVAFDTIQVRQCPPPTTTTTTTTCRI